MKEMIMAFLAWLKKTLAKESLFILLAVLLAAVLSWITEKFWLRYTADDNARILQELELTKERYRVYLFITYMLFLYGIRFVEAMIRTMIISVTKKE